MKTASTFLLSVLLAACPPTDDDGSDDDTALFDDDSVGDDDSTLADDDASGDDDDSGGDDDITPPADGCSPAWAESEQPIVLSDGSASGLRWSLSLAAGSLGEDEGATFELVVQNPGPLPFSAEWDNCGFPDFAILGNGDVVLWEGSEDDDIDCDGLGILALDPGDSQTWTFQAPPAGGGPLTARARSNLAVFGPDGTPQSGPSGGAYLPFDVTAALFVSDSPYCPTPAATGSFLPGFDLSITAEAPTIPAGLGLTLSGAALVGLEDVPGPWDHCGMPEFAVYDPEGVLAWRWSDADKMDCPPAERLDGLAVTAWDEFVPTSVIDRAGVWTVETSYYRLGLVPGDEWFAVRTTILATE